MKALLVFGARPNLIKIAPLYREMIRDGEISPILVNTGQHFDAAMSDALREGLELPKPEIELGIGPGEPTVQIARIMESLAPILKSMGPDVLVVVGDVNSTLAAALTASTVGVPLAHVEAGLRSRDWSMPEERNRVITDRLSQYLFTPSQDADDNLRAEGIEANRIFQVGNVMIDSLDWVMDRLPREEVRARHGVPESGYGLVTLHRPSNVDSPGVLAEILRGLEAVGGFLPLLFPIHPRTARRLTEFGLRFDPELLRPLAPLPYADFICLLSDARLMITDSGGIQEETTVLGVPCLTLRENTERPITLSYGVNELVSVASESIRSAAEQALRLRPIQAKRPPLWDGKTASRIVRVLKRRGRPYTIVIGPKQHNRHWFRPW